MSDADIQDDIIGRVRNTPLKKSQAVITLCEAVANSLYAVEAIGPNAHIQVGILRSTQTDVEKSALAPIVGFEIADNGVGFIEANYTSFRTADSRQKQDRGGKGVGRFIWLKAFALVDVASVYVENGKRLKRTFQFVAQSRPIQRHEVSPTEEELRTAVTLRDIKPPYEGSFPGSAHALADRLTRHLLVFLINESCPEIKIADKATEDFLDVKKHFQDHLHIASTKAQCVVKDQTFDLTFVRMHAGANPSHRVVFCADGREVVTHLLHALIPDLKDVAVPSPDGQKAELWLVVSGDYLDRSVNQERTSFMFADAESVDADGFDVTQDELNAGVAAACRLELQSFLETLEGEKLRRVEEFVRRSEPEYRVLLKHAKDEIRKIPANLSDSKLDTELHKLLHSVELQLKEEGREILAGTDDAKADDPEYVRRYDEYVEKLLDYRSSELAKYVIHRKTIIELLTKAIGMRPDGKFPLEDQVHRILCPPRITSDDMEFGQQNLWLIDEKLTYHHFLASDTEMSKLRVIDSDSSNRADILIFDKPSAFVEGEFPHQSIVIIELKRPQRRDYVSGDQEKDPIEQVFTYIEDIQTGKVLDETNQFVNVNEKTQFFCYILADMTEKLRTITKRKDMDVTIDGLGYYKYFKRYNAQVEVITYRKLLEDAKRRNRVLFTKLGLPGYA